MFSSKKHSKAARVDFDSLIGKNTALTGDITFSGGLHVDGKLTGNVYADESSSTLTLSDHGVIEGDVRVPNVILNGTIIGDVYVSQRIELAANARVQGNVYYRLIEMAMGAEVNGNLVHQPPAEEPDKKGTAKSREAGSEPKITNVNVKTGADVLRLDEELKSAAAAVKSDKADKVGQL